MASENQNSVPQREDLRIVPSENYTLHVFLMKVAKSITEEEFRELKFYCSGHGGIRRAACEQIKDCISLFDHMEKLRLLSSYNLAPLQAMIWHIGRKDLYKEFVEFCKLQDNVLYFFVPSEQPTNGYRHVDFHIQGTKSFNQVDLQDLKVDLSTLLCCPIQHIITDGIEPTSSIHITFMIPEWCVDILLGIGQEYKSVLHSRGVDRFKADDMFVDCKEFEIGEHKPSLDKDAAVKQLLQQHSRLEKDVGTYQIELENLKKENTDVRTKLKVAEQELEDRACDVIDCLREFKYVKETSDENICALEKAKNEYQLNCLHLTSDLELCKKELSKCQKTDTLLYSRRGRSLSVLRRTLSQSTKQQLEQRSSYFQSKIIKMLKISQACEITSEIMKIVQEDRNDVDILKTRIYNHIDADVVDEVYGAVLNLKSIEDAMEDKFEAGSDSEMYVEDDQEELEECLSDASSCD